jgi:hypothetical protein
MFPQHQIFLTKLNIDKHNISHFNIVSDISVVAASDHNPLSETTLPEIIFIFSCFNWITSAVYCCEIFNRD